MTAYSGIEAQVSVGGRCELASDGWTAEKCEMDCNTRTGVCEESTTVESCCNGEAETSQTTIFYQV